MNSILNIIDGNSELPKQTYGNIPFAVLINEFYIILAAYEINVEYNFVTQFN